MNATPLKVATPTPKNWAFPSDIATQREQKVYCIIYKMMKAHCIPYDIFEEVKKKGKNLPTLLPPVAHESIMRSFLPIPKNNLSRSFPRRFEGWQQLNYEIVYHGNSVVFIN